MSNTEEKEITQKSQTNFLYSFSLLPREKSDAINTVYAFCRKTDDIVDDENITIKAKHKNIRKWRNEFEKSLEGKSEYNLLNSLNKVIHRFDIPVQPFFELIKGMEMDLNNTRYRTFEELYDYCYCAAATVGLMCIEIFGYKNSRTRDFAVNLGIALQLTNILRDLKKDAENGRIYLPMEDLEKFGYSPEDLMANKYNDSFIELMKYETERAREYYRKANSFLTKEDKGLMFSARIMEHIYFTVLKKIERMNYNVFDKVARVSKFKKIFIALGVYSKYKLLYSFDDPRFAVHNE